jgi:cellulose synthase/poly-beta-1,6-N-acetylglucosamine synthase-like glycosyltransferase
MKKIILNKTAILIPAHNEKQVIVTTIKSALGLVPASDVFVVDDCSTDTTSLVARKYTKNVLTLTKNLGKANSLNTAIKHFKLDTKYSYILPMDADTRIDSDFLAQTLPHFTGKKNRRVIAVSGKVVGGATNWVTCFRMWEYEIGQLIHKNAQSNLGAISVCPGCATIYKASLFSKVTIPDGTLTEDMGFTFLIYRKRLGEIRYCSKAKVYTQDPKTLKDLLRQLDRWYTGFWQCLIRYNFPWEGQMVDFEVALAATEALLSGTLAVVALLIAPYLLLTNPKLVFIPIMLDLLLFVLPTVLYTAIKARSWKLLYVFPTFYLLRILSNLVFLKSFFKTVIGIDFHVGWNKVKRYQVKEEKWALSIQ